MALRLSGLHEVDARKRRPDKAQAAIRHFAMTLSRNSLMALRLSGLHEMDARKRRPDKA
jgi:hypothetical protein